jgi:hypothetical protein
MKEAYVVHGVTVQRHAAVAATSVAVYFTVPTNEIYLHFPNSGNRTE